MAFDFKITGEIIPNTTYLNSPDQIARARATIDLYGLDKAVTAQGNSDDRLMDRVEAIKQAIDRLIEYSTGTATIAAIVDNAKNTGFFSVWLRIFSTKPLVKAALINEPDFHQANTGCYNGINLFVPRNPANLTDPI